MNRFFKVLGMAVATSSPFIYKAVRKAYTIDETAEGIDLEKIPDSIRGKISDMLIFSVTKERDLANDIAMYFNVRLGKIQTSQTGPGQETQINIMESVRGKKVFLVCCFDTTRWSLNETMIDLFLTISAMKRNSALQVNVVIPYYAYCRQNSPTAPRRKALFAADMAKLLEAAGADQVFSVNLHSTHIHGSFDIPLVNVDASILCASYFKEHNFKDLILVCANDRIFPQAVKIQEMMKNSGQKVDVGILAEQPSKSTEKFNYIGKDVTGRDVLIIDSIMDTGKTALEASKCMTELGARDVYMFAVHALLNENALEHINNSNLKELVVTNTFPLNMSKLSEKINQISIAPMLAEAMAQAAFNVKMEQMGSKDLLRNMDE